MSPEIVSPHPSHEDLYAYRDGELTAERRRVVEAHVVGCRACRESIDEISALEAQLRMAPDAADEEYYDSLAARAMVRVRAADSAPLVERRRAAAEIAQAEARVRPRFAWPALTAAVGAAATVLVVVGLLIREQAAWRSAPDVAVLERSAPDAARSRAGARSDTTVPPPPPSAPPLETQTKETLGKKDVAVSAPTATDEGLSAKSEESKQKLQEFGETSAESRAIGSVSNQERQESDAVAQRAPAAAAPAPEAGAALMRDAPMIESAYAATLRRFSLPPVWGPGVSDDLVLRAEPALRNMYRTGGAATALDSARVRLYLAEAARIRLGSSVPDSATVETITHHYRRAISLGASDASTRNTASARLEDFQRELSEP